LTNFYRIRTEKTRQVVGSGLGLPLVKDIVEAHLGMITVESNPEKETNFYGSSSKGHELISREQRAESKKSSSSLSERKKLKCEQSNDECFLHHALCYTQIL